jgi:hypothetical protein
VPRSLVLFSFFGGRFSENAHFPQTFHYPQKITLGISAICPWNFFRNALILEKIQFPHNPLDSGFWVCFYEPASGIQHRVSSILLFITNRPVNLRQYLFFRKRRIHLTQDLFIGEV